MKKQAASKFLNLLAPVCALAWLGAGPARADVIVTAATGGTGLSADLAQNGAAPGFTALGSIVIQESASSEFRLQTNKTLMRPAPRGGRFNAAVGGASGTRRSGPGRSEWAVNS